MARRKKSILDKIKCPKCGAIIPITETLQHQLTEGARKEMEDESKKALINKEAELRRHFSQQKAKLEEAAKKKAESALSMEMRDLRSQLREQEAKLQESQKAELSLRKRERELEAAMKSMELEVARKVDAERGKIAEEVSKRITEENRMRELEKEKQINDLRRQIDDLKRKAEQGSQQLQGEVQELDLEAVLKEQFPYDTIRPVPKGVGGADVIQEVISSTGNSCGAIVWESKRTKGWSSGWIPKLKDDQRAVGADVAVLVTEVLPKGVRGFALQDGIWVADYPSVPGLATALREGLIHVARIKRATEGKDEKMEILFRYLTGPQFRQRVEAIVGAFRDMQEELSDEKRTTMKRWAKREKQIERVVFNTAGMYGDLQGLIGSSLQDIPALEAGEKDREDQSVLPGDKEMLSEEDVDSKSIPF